MQVLKERNAHWITISTIGCEPSTVNVYDSGRGSLSTHSRRLVADILQTQENAIKIQYMDTQWQSGGADCGLFALAFAASLCCGQDPTADYYDQRQMRTHPLGAIELGVLLPFPTRGHRRQIQKSRVEFFPVFCVCRLTDNGTKMIQCSRCGEWYHTECINIEKNSRHSALEWNCSLC